MALPEKVVEVLIAGSFGIVGTLMTAAVAWVRDRGVATQRVHQLEEATKRPQFWDQWVKLATDLPLPMDEVCMAAVQREMNMLLRLLETSSHSLESALTLQRSQTTALSEMVYGLPPLRRALLLYTPARSLAWFPRAFFYMSMVLALVSLLALADPDHGASVKEVLLVELFLITAAVIFRSLSEWLEKPRLTHGPPPRGVGSAADAGPCGRYGVMPEELIQIVEVAVTDAYRRGGGWLACRPGCSQCCVGVFPIGWQDADRLRDGLLALGESDPERAERVRARTAAALTRLDPWFPGDLATGVLGESYEEAILFEEFANDEPCPALDLNQGTCDLYAARPVLCRTFGPPMRTEEGNLATCELCFIGADTEEIARCELDPAIPEIEAASNAAYEAATGCRGETLIAYALRGI